MTQMTHRDTAAGDGAPLRVRALGSFHIGGEEVHLSGLAPDVLPISGGIGSVSMDPNGAYEVGQMYVQFVRLAGERDRAPVLLMHGGGMTGAMWESTPDGRTGWQSRLLEAGHDVYVADSVERGRASWARYPDIYPAPPLFRSKKDIWEAFRIGPMGTYEADPAARTPYPATAFPLDAFDQLAKQCVPRWTHTDALALAAYRRCLERIGPCALVAHSQGCAFAFALAVEMPSLVEAVVAIEPGGFPGPDADLASLVDVPLAVLWGDNVEDHPFWGPTRLRSKDFVDAVTAAGGRAELVDLPTVGIAGNSHLPMGDLNSDAVAALVTGRLSGAPT
ncbi:esterase [Pseudonocardia ailaonensis]|uniref:Esterase n=1 Tax=Pseudonocardia ailaonensis TaxID=367279 RepID=A0ABN2MI60_9PSEU